MTILFWILIVILAALALIVALGLMQSTTFAYRRQADYKAAPAKIFAHINDFHNWSGWSPWEAMDPNMQRTHSGASSGVGAKYAWTGNNKVGEGSMEITQSEPSKRMQLDLHFIKPFKADNITEFTLTPKGSGTNVVWEMRGDRPLMIRIMGLFMDMDKMIGKDFEKGLENLRGIVDK